MGQGEEVKTRAGPKIEILERGEIFFFYRPKIGKEEVHGADDVQRLYIILLPESGEKGVEEKQSPDSGKEGDKRSGNKEEVNTKNTSTNREKSEGGHGTEEVNIEKQMVFRFIIMGRKSLPDPSRRSRPYWGFVEMVTTKAEDIKATLKGEEYDTSTRGHRRQAPARALAEGVYRILRHQSGRGMHTHLIYKLELPAEPNEPQKELNIEHEGSFIIQIKNPEQSGRTRSSGGFGGLQSKRRAAFPASLQGCFGKRRYAPADPPDFLNYEGCEFLMISASDDIEEELGLDLLTESDGESERREAADVSCSDLIKMFGDDGDAAVEFKPLFKGTWV